VTVGDCVARVLQSGVGKQITQRELRNNSGEIMRQLDQGESFVVTRNGIPVGELSPLRRNRFISAEAAVAAFRGAPPVALDRFRADLDRAASQEITPRG
jgi:antitoxin (DNA-binding transcriptional repressor) of toxin-antitoxin stability system